MVSSYLMGLHSSRCGLKQKREQEWLLQEVDLSKSEGPLLSTHELVSISPIVNGPFHMLSIKGVPKYLQ